MTLWLYIYFPALQLNAIYQSSEYQAVPLIVVDERTNEVVQLNQLAKNEGVTTGMGLGTAASLCRNLQVKPYDEATEAAYLKHIAHHLYQVSADIVLYPPNGLLLRVSNMLSLYANVEHYWQQLSLKLQHLSIEYHYATAYSPHAARLLAKQKLDQLCDDNEQLTKQIEQQAISSAELENKVITRLEKVGVKRFADILKLPLSDLMKRFSIDVVNYITQLTGQAPHYLDFYTPPEHFEQYLELSFEVANQQYLEKPLLRLYRLLEDHLRLKDKLTSELDLLLHQRDDSHIQLIITAAQGEYLASKWLQLTLLNLESVELVAPVVGITLTVKQLTHKYAQHNDLFEGSQGSLSAKELIALLTAKLGQQKVRGVVAVADDRPEMANQLCAPFTGQTLYSTTNYLRPSLLLPCPLLLQEKVMVMSSPERIIAGWWDDNKVVRDYFIGRSHDGRWLWLFRDQNCQWFVHGVFS